MEESEVGFSRFLAAVAAAVRADRAALEFLGSEAAAGAASG